MPSPQVLRPFVESGFVLLLQSAYPPPRYDIRETASGAKWAGYREVLGRCLTQALLEHTCWLLHLAVGQIPNGPFIPPSATPRDQNNNVLPLYSRCGVMHTTEDCVKLIVSPLACRYMCLRLWPSQDDAGEPAPAPRQPLPPDHGALPRSLRLKSMLMRCARPTAPWLLNVPVAYAELAARGPHAVVGQAGSIMGRAACTKCRGMNPLLGTCAADLSLHSVLICLPHPAGLQDRFTPEVDPCVAYYDTDHARKKCIALATRICFARADASCAHSENECGA